MKKTSMLVPFIASLGPLLMGYQIGMIGSALIFIKKDFLLHTKMVGLIASMVIIGTMAGVLAISFCANRMDRRYFIALSTVISAFSLLLQTLANSALLLLIGRFLSGFAVGVVLVIVPLYLGEIADPKRRGAYLGIFQLSITFGVLLGYFMSFLLAYYMAWRSMFGFGVLLSVIQLLTVYLLPASPLTLQKIPVIKASSEYLLAKKYRRSLIIGCTLATLHQVTGINAIAFFAPQIMTVAQQHSTTGAIFASFILMIGNFVFTIFSLFVFDHFGRRPMLNLSLFIQGVSLAMLGFISFANHGVMLSSLLLLYLLSYAIGLGPGVWLIASEIFPLAIRDKAVGVTVMVNNIAAFLVVSSFLSLLDVAGKNIVFYSYSLAAFLGWLFVVILLPETKGKSLE